MPIRREAFVALCGMTYPYPEMMSAERVDGLGALPDEQFSDSEHAGQLPAPEMRAAAGLDRHQAGR